MQVIQVNATLRTSVVAAALVGVAASANVFAHTGANRSGTRQPLGEYVSKEADTGRSAHAATMPQPFFPTCGDRPVLTRLRAAYGDLTSCGLAGNAWVIAMYGAYDATTKTHRSGGLAVYQCRSSVSACLDPSSPHPTSGWKVHLPPYHGSVTLLAGSSHDLVVDNAGHQICFAISTMTYLATCSSD